jgi:hypothetical protein
MLQVAERDSAILRIISMQENKQINRFCKKLCHSMQSGAPRSGKEARRFALVPDDQRRVAQQLGQVRLLGDEAGAVRAKPNSPLSTSVPDDVDLSTPRATWICFQ